MLPMFPMLAPEIPSIERSKDQARNDDVYRQAAPETYGHDLLASCLRLRNPYAVQHHISC